MQLAKKVYSGRTVHCLHADGDLDLATFRKALANGDILILHGIRRYDSRLKPILTKRIVERGML